MGRLAGKAGLAGRESLEGQDGRDGRVGQVGRRRDEKDARSSVRPEAMPKAHSLAPKADRPTLGVVIERSQLQEGRDGQDRAQT